MKKIMNSPDFIGLGAQKSGTSWIYACLYEHPEIYIPIKEIHFFSRERNWSKGFEWYESHFSTCPGNKLTGEFSTSYLVSEEAPGRIYRRYPNAKLLLSLRNPVERAYSNYKNDLMAGKIERETPFRDAIKTRSEYTVQGFYSRLLIRYLALFPREKIHVLIYEDSLSDPLAFIQSIFRFLEVDTSFVPSVLNKKVNKGYLPKNPWVENQINNITATLRNIGMSNLVWQIKKTGIAEKIRGMNTRRDNDGSSGPTREDKLYLQKLFKDDIQRVEEIIGRELPEWRD